MDSQQKNDDSKRPVASQQEQESAPPFLDHDPIIITGGGSVFMGFDGPKEEHYRLIRDENLIRYSSGAELTIKSVEVLVGTSAHSCPGVPAHGRCTVTIQGRRSSKPDSSIAVIGRDQGVTIEFDNKEYQEQPASEKRKNFGHQDRKIKRLTIRNDVTGKIKDCTIIPPDGKCNVVIYDRHR